MKSHYRWLSLFVLFALLLSACTINITTKVNADGSGEMGFVMKFNAEDIKVMTDMGSTEDELCTASSSDTDMELKQEKHGDEIWCVGSQKYDTLADLKQALGNGDGFTVNTLEIKDGKFVYDADIDMSGATEELPMTITMAYELTVPGKVGKNDADKVSGNTLSWELKMGEKRHLHAESQIGGGGLGFDLGDNTVLIGVIVALCCCSLLVVVVVVVVVVLVMRKKSAPAPAGPPAA